MIINILLAFAGHAFYLSKLWGESIKRKEEFITKSFIASEISNVIAIPIMVYIAPTLPPELFIMSPIGAIIIGWLGSSMLGGFINVKKPKDIE